MTRGCVESPMPLNETRPCVLIIDDSPDVHRLLRARLKQEEIDLEMAATGDDGLRQAAERQPALIVLDMDMPGMDGFEVLRRLKEHSRTHQIPVIVLSGLHSPRDKVTAFDLGAIDYITKPFEITELRVRMRSALRLHQLVQMLEQKAQIDGLTGLWNRAYFDSRWQEESSRASRHLRSLSVAMLDVDHFKSVNDTYGHAAGDTVLSTLARTLVRECRQTDIVCRVGGEEFALLMPDTGPTDARDVCERIRATLEGLTWPRHPERRVTVSIGVVGSASPGVTSPGEWLEIADRNLYAAKQAGRNRVVMTDLGAARFARAG